MIVDTTSVGEFFPLALIEGGETSATETRYPTFEATIMHADPIRRWSVIDKDGLMLGYFALFGGRGQFRLIGKLEGASNGMTIMEASSIEEGFEKFVGLLPPLIQAEPEREAVWIVDQTLAEDKPFKLSAVGKRPYGFIEERNYDPETFKQYSQPLVRTIET